jgi:hypothetical protein
MEQWSKKPYFLDRTGVFYSPLESAATLGIMRAFRVYKPAPRVASFLEIEHYGNGWAKKLAARNAACEGQQAESRGLGSGRTPSA